MKSKTIIITASIVIIIAIAAFFYYRSQLQERFGSGSGGVQSGQEGGIPQSRDLCGGTGGIGQIVGVKNNTITLKRKDGKNLLTHLTSQTTIRMSTGSASLSDLKIGDSVTLIGGPNPDGSFTADTVVVCTVIDSETPSEEK